MISLDSSIDVIPVPAFMTGKDGSISYLNDSFRNMIISEKYQSISNLFDHFNFQKDDGLLLASIQDRHFLFLRHQVGEQFFYFGREGKHFQELQQQVSELKKLNRELDSIIDSSYDGIYITDNKGVTLKTNTAIERITGIPKEYYIGKNVAQLVDRGILKDSVTSKVIEQRRTVSVVQKNFEGKETLITGSPVMNEDGDIEKVITNIRDLSELNGLLEELKEVQKRNNQYEKELKRLKGFSEAGIIVESQKMRELYEMAERIADFDATVLILGETGVGKDVLARFIHRSSSRNGKGDFIKVNCGAIPTDLLESELFGYEAGAFTGANKKGKPGMFEVADKGVLFLDEVGELPLKLQVKLLQAIQDGVIQRVGSTKVKKVDVRIIAATNRALQDMVEQGEFREDLYYRLNVIPFSVPPLRERRDDILPLIQFFLDKTNVKYGLNKGLEDDLKNFLYELDWSGNVREMSNLIERLVLTTSSNTVTTAHLPEEYKRKEHKRVNVTELIPLKDAAEIAERQILLLATERYSSTYQIAKALETSQPTIVRKMKKYGIAIDFRDSKL
ncbi:sigma-54 interaction domain-containing protein [Pseudalkalibacillus sp. A8]|uniref:sigma-54 interaction domain-containing protein n=1 Tax=Pseudalkalibacillus sp. A8 TaxID=3382641 RepID=UPI0038B4F3AF